jgi:hypothetical protein
MAQPKSFWDALVEAIFGPPSKPAPPRTPKPPRKISKAEFDALVSSRALLLAMGQVPTALHFELARQQVQKELADDNVSVMGRFSGRARQARGISEAAAEAGGEDKL